MNTIDVINIRTRPLDPWKWCARTKEEWPESSDKLCWWCCHGFQTVPCMLPVRFDEQTREIHATGIFCSWNCVKRYAFVIQQSRSTPPPGASYISILARLTCMRCADDTNHSLGLCECDPSVPIRISMAGDRETLEAFGGSKTIDQFRAGFLCIQSHDRLRYIFEASTSQSKMRNCKFSRVKYEGPAQIYQSTVQVLPFSSRSVVAPNMAPSRTSASTLLPTPTAHTSRRTRIHRAPLANPPSQPRSQMLAVNEEQAFYAKRLNAGGNMLTSMGVTVKRQT